MANVSGPTDVCAPEYAWRAPRGHWEGSAASPDDARMFQVYDTHCRSGTSRWDTAPTFEMIELQMPRSFRRAALVAAVAVSSLPAASSLGAQTSGGKVASYGVGDSMLVGHVTGRWYDIDVVNRRLFGAGNTIIDIDQLRVIGHIADSTPGTVYFVAAEDERGLTSSGVVFNPTTGAAGEHMPIHGNGIAYEPETRRAFLLGDTIRVVNLAPSMQAFPMMQRSRQGGMGGGGSMGSPTGMNQDPRRDTMVRRLPPVRLTATIVGEIPLPSAAVAGVADGLGHLYVAVPGRDSVLRIDGDKLRITGGRPVTGCKSASALAIDNVHQRLFVGCDSGLVVSNT